jgi:fatty acid desaturase
MLDREEQRQLDELAQRLRTTDPDFAARMGSRPPRRGRFLVAVSVLLWATVPALAFVGGWAAGMLSGAVLAVAGVLVLKTPRW